MSAKSNLITADADAKVRAITAASDAGIITFTFADNLPSITINSADFSDAMRAEFLVHGIIQKIRDGAALPKGATLVEKRDAMIAILDTIREGNWSKRGNGDGDSPVSGLIYRAYRQFIVETCAAKSIAAPDEVKTRAAYDARDRAAKLALRTNPAISAIMETLRRPSTSVANVDTDALLAELGA